MNWNCPGETAVGQGTNRFCLPKKKKISVQFIYIYLKIKNHKQHSLCISCCQNIKGKACKMSKNNNYTYIFVQRVLPVFTHHPMLVGWDNGSFKVRVPILIYMAKNKNCQVPSTTIMMALTLPVRMRKMLPPCQNLKIFKRNQRTDTTLRYQFSG